MYSTVCVQCSPIIRLCLGSIGMDFVISDCVKRDNFTKKL